MDLDRLMNGMKTIVSMMDSPELQQKLDKMSFEEGFMEIKTLLENDCTSTEPTFTFVESCDLPFQTFLRQRESWLQYGMMGPDTKNALVGTLATNAPKDLLVDRHTVSCLFIEPDPTAIKDTSRKDAISIIDHMLKIGEDSAKLYLVGSVENCLELLKKDMGTF